MRLRVAGAAAGVLLTGLLVAGCGSGSLPNNGLEVDPNGPYTAAAGSAVTFSGAGSRSPAAGALQYIWAFGDGASGSGLTVSHIYTSAGSYGVTLTLSDTAGHSAKASTTAVIYPVPQSLVAHGNVHGGQQPVANSTIQIWQVGTTGYGQGAAPLGSSVQTDGNGNFALTGQYSCANAANGANSLVYVTAAGGNPGLSTGTNNTAILMMSALGRCGDLGSNTFIQINEVTTAASVWSLAQFLSAAGAIGAPGATSAGLVNAFATVNNLVLISQGRALQTTPAGNGVVPQAKLNALGDAVAACVNSATAGSMPCTQLFGAVTPINGAAPTTIMGALLSIALHPAYNATAILNMVNSSPPFEPVVSSVNDWTLAVGFAGGGSVASGLALDSAGDVWMANYGGSGGSSSSVSLLGPTGVSGSNSPYVTGVNGAVALALDPSNNAYIVNRDNNSALVLSASGSGAGLTITPTGTPLTGLGLASPSAVAVDASANVWFTNTGTNSLTELAAGTTTGSGFGSLGLSSPSGLAFDELGALWVANAGSATVSRIAVAAPVTATAVAVGPVAHPGAVAIDASSNVWLPDGTSGVVSELNQGGFALSGTAGLTGGALTASQGVAIDGAGSAWITDTTGNAVTVAGADRTILSGTTGLQDASLSAPGAVAIDGSGNVWIADGQAATVNGKVVTVTELVGAASPVITPLAAALGARSLGSRPGLPQLPLAVAGGPYTGVVNTAIAFTGSASSDPQGETLSFAWNFGDGATATSATPQHAFSAAGAYPVTLTVTDTDGHARSVGTVAVVVAATPLGPQLNAGGPYTGDTATAVGFSAVNSYDPANPTQGVLALTLSWNFGDGTQGAGATPIHTYSAPGTYTVTLTGTTATGGTAQVTTTATVTQGTPVAGTPTAKPNGPYSGVVGQTIQFSDAGSSDPNSLALTYYWDLGDGTTYTGSDPTHAYTSPGSFSVVLLVTNGSQTTQSSTVATITAAPAKALVANAGGPYTAQQGQPLQLDGSGTTNPHNRVLTYTWDFGDGSAGSGAQPYHVYANQGTFKASLSVSDGVGAVGNASAQVTVGPAPAEAVAASAGGPYSGTVGQTLTFDASASRDNLNAPLSYSWSFGDGSAASGVYPTHAYATSGSFTATVTATSSNNVVGSATAQVVITAIVGLTITSPTPNQLFATTAIPVTGTVSDSTAQIVVNGVTATVSGNTFSAQGVQLREGVNVITASATGAAGSVGSAAVTVIDDVTAPGIAITQPATGASIGQSNITVAGLVNDSVTGTVGSNDVTVTLNGVAAQVSNRSFMLTNVLLTPGANTLTAVATDKVGNTSQTQINVSYLPQTQALRLVPVSGDAQSGAVGALLASPLVVQLQAADGTPVAGRTVTFTVTRSDGMVEVMPNKAQTLMVITDATGKASVLFQLGTRQGLAVNQVTASTPGAVGTLLFSASSTAAAPTTIHAVRGNSQRGLLGAPLAEAFQVIVTDAYANPVPGVTVNWTSTGAGDGTLDHASSVTDSNGKAYASLTLGQQEGTNNYIASGDFSGDLGQASQFQASAFAPGPVAQTVVSGVVLDNANTPIPNATVRLQGTTLQTVTGADGTFSLSSAPVGTVVLTVDGSTSTRTQSFPFLSFVLQDLPGVNNTLNKPIYLPFIDVDNAQTVGGDDAVTLSMKGVPGVSFVVAPHSVTFPDGSTVGKLSLSQVKSDMVPMEPTNGSAPDLIWTLQPAGTKFNPPIQITTPNTQGLPPGTVGEFYQFDHDLEQFVSAGTSHVVADGSVVVSDSGFGISKAGWGHTVSFPVPPDCNIQCDDNNQCTTDTVVKPGTAGGGGGGGGNGCPTCQHKPVPDGTSCQVSPYRDPNTGQVFDVVSQCQLPGQCVNGGCVAQMKENGTPCDDHVYCTNPDQCLNGACTGTPVGSSTLTLIPGSLLKFEKGFNTGLVEATEEMQNLGLKDPLVVNFNPYGTATYSCCEAQRGAITEADKAGLDISGKFSFPKFPIPGASILVPGVGVQGLYATAALKAGGTIEFNSDLCTGKYCFSGGAFAEVDLEVGLNVQLPAGIMANVSGQAGVALKAQGGCGSSTVTVGFTGLNAVLQGEFPYLGNISIEIPVLSAAQLGAVTF